MDKYILVYDFETGNIHTDATNGCPIQIAGMIINARTFEPLGEEFGGIFEHLMCPINPDKIEEEALKVNKKNREDILSAPEEKVVLDSFVNWANKFNISNGKKSIWNKPVAAGHNIMNFDVPLLKSLCQRNKIDYPFHPRDYIDTMNIAWLFFQNVSDKPNGYSLDHLRDYFGISKEGGHDAFKDVKDTSWILSKFMNYFTQIAKKTKFRGSFVNG